MKKLLMLMVVVLSIVFTLDISLADDVGKRLFETKCSECHRLDLPLAERHDKDGWKVIVERMKTYGANIDSKEADSIIEYLVKERGKK